MIRHCSVLIAPFVEEAFDHGWATVGSAEAVGNHRRARGLSSDEIADPIRNPPQPSCSASPTMMPSGPLDELREDLDSDGRATAALAGLVVIRHQLGLCGQRVHFDPILDEAHAAGDDTRRLIDLFGLSFEAASRYASTVNPLGGGERR